MKKNILSGIVVLLSLLLVLPAAAVTDLPEQHQFYEEIMYMMEKGVMEEDSKGRIRPDADVTRAEAHSMIARLKDSDGTRTKMPSGNAPLRRGDAAVLLEEAFNLPHTFNQEFKDVASDSKYYSAIGKMLAANIMIGYPDGTFRPREKVSRGEFAAFLARVLEPKFKNDAAIEGSYQKDKTKTYTYGMSDGSTAVHRFANEPDRDGLGYGFMWTVEVEGDLYEYFEFESHQFFAFGYPYSEYYPALVYPAEVGMTFNVGLGDEIILYTITGINMTVETPYRTFTDATEVTAQDGSKYYMAKGHSTIKSLNAEGTVESVLMDVE